MIDHVSIYVRSLARSKEFYEKVLAPLGFQLAFGEEGKFWAFRLDHGSLFEIFQAKETDIFGTVPCHVAIRTASRESVEAFYRAALKAGGKCNGPPGLRPHYTPNYFAAFILDPDGYNVEAMHDAN